MKKLGKSVLLISFILCSFIGSAFAADPATTQKNLPNKIVVDGKTFKLGCKMPTSEQLKSMPRIHTLDMRASIPSVYDLTINFPRPGNQGSQGSCVAWATGYAYKSFQEKLDHKWALNTNDHLFSPAYIYNQINGGQDKGAYVNDAMALMKKQGVCSLKTMPYNQYDYRTQPNTTQKRAAAGFLAKTWGVVDGGNVDAIKRHLAAGDAVVVGIPVYDDFDNISASHPVYEGIGDKLLGYHALCIVGYDDNKKAFKFINSWGTNWGINGFGYMGYNFIKQDKTTAYVMTDVLTGMAAASGQ